MSPNINITQVQSNLS